jgi:hypothetical protein
MTQRFHGLQMIPRFEAARYLTPFFPFPAFHPHAFKPAAE